MSNDYEALLDEFRALPATVKRPPTFLEITNYPHYENVCSNVLAFYLDPENPHGLENLLLDALARALGVEAEGEGVGGNVSVQREVVTDAGNRIDILIESDTSVILIENKIRAAAVNPFPDYSDFLDGLVTDGRRKHKLLLTLFPSEGGSEWGFVNRTHAEFTAQVRSMLGHYAARADTRYLTLLLDFLNTMENLQEGSRMDDRFRNLLSEREEEVERFLGEIKAFKDELRGKVRDLGGRVEVGEHDNVRQWYWREPTSLYDDLGHDISVSGHLPVVVDATIYPSGWEISMYSRGDQHRGRLVELLRRLEIPLEDERELIHARFAYDEDPERIAPVVQTLVEKIATATDVPG
jgi:hypothetical protein